MTDSESPGPVIGDDTLAAAILQSLPKHIHRALCHECALPLIDLLEKAGITTLDENASAQAAAAILPRSNSAPSTLANDLRDAFARVGPQGFVCIPADKGAHPNELGESFSTIQDFAARCNAVIYQAQALGSDNPSELADADAVILWLVHKHYNPIAHADELINENRAHDAIALVTSIPPELVDTADAHEALAHVRHQAFIALMEKADAQARAQLFDQAQRIFFYAAHENPDAAYLYTQYADLWTRVGLGQIAQRISASTSHALNTPREEISIESQHHKPPQYGPWSGAYKPRTLIIAHDGNDYGVDTLYDGLCEIIGAENVVEFPYKPGLHGAMTHDQCPYPCLFNHPGEPRSIREVADELLAEKFDLVVYADAIGRTHPKAVQALIKASTGTPCALYDAGDEFRNRCDEMCARAGIENYLAYFKREMLTAIDYGPIAWPLPFGYPKAYLPNSIENTRSEDLFWAGTPAFGMRPLYINHLERALGKSLRPQYSQAEYTAALLRARTGLSLFGWGFDTVRYWEVPAHGAMLIAERPPIHIPNNFVHSESAIFFNDLQELEETLAHYAKHPEETITIAAKAHAHFHTHHLTSTRAKQFLGTIETQLYTQAP